MKKPKHGTANTHNVPHPQDLRKLNSQKQMLSSAGYRGRAGGDGEMLVRGRSPQASGGHGLGDQGTARRRQLTARHRTPEICQRRLQESHPCTLDTER